MELGEALRILRKGDRARLMSQTVRLLNPDGKGTSDVPAMNLDQYLAKGFRAEPPPRAVQPEPAAQEQDRARPKPGRQQAVPKGKGK